MEEGIRIDKWLWAVRLFKTRNQATEACRAGKVKTSGQAVKPSREVKLQDVFTVNTGVMTKTVKVMALLHQRIGARLVPDYMEDLTPPEEIERLQMLKELNYERRDRGTGRPTKKSRRDIDRLKGH